MSNEHIKCEICGGNTHSIQIHIKSDHPDWTIDKYKETFPEAPLFSPLALQKLKEREAGKQKKSVSGDVRIAPLHELFKLGNKSEALSSTGQPIGITVFGESENDDMIPPVDPNYVFNIDCLKNALMALDLNCPLLVWGHAGTGKTTLIEQIAAYTNRPTIRVQHTMNTEEAQIVGLWTAKGGETKFELGPLAMAMKYGWLYIADEYDFGLPSVLAVYQPVLEGKALVIKEADAANRIIKPHPNFRFVATGNTNGSGDEHNIYLGTQIQNAANYDRFNVVLQMDYMPAKQESEVLVKQAGVAKGDADKLVDFANRIRDAFKTKKVSLPISPRTLIAVARIGICKGSYMTGIQLSFANKLSEVDKSVVNGVAQRIWGS